MDKRNQEITEVIVKPIKASLFEVVSDISEGLYKTLNQGEKICKVQKGSDGKLEMDMSCSSRGVKEEDIKGIIDVKWDSSVPFSEKWVDVSGHTEKRKLADSSVYGSDFERYYLTDMEGVIELDNGKFLINSYGKYKPNLSFITSVPQIEYERKHRHDLNFDRGDFYVIYGEYFVSKKGTKCFRVLPKKKAKHILIRDKWGGAFNDYRGRTLPEEKSIYYRRASSNGGGTGYDYAVYDVNFRNALSEDNI